MENLTGKQLGPYRVVAPLGEGGMAAVFKAYQAGMDRYVALKVLPQQLAADPQFVGRFKQEAQVLAKLQHPHILPVFDFGESEGYTYIVMPFVESGTLTNLLTGTPLPVGQIRAITTQVGDALDYAHSLGLVHRDIKPSNVLIDKRGNCLLTDFGIAKIVEGTARFTHTGTIMGTPAYMSPEQGRGAKVDQRTDIYALGVMVYEMATGRVPFDAETPIAIVFKHISDPLPLPSLLNPKLPDGLERVILKALAKDPDERFATAGEMVRAIKTALPDSPAITETMVAPPTPTAVRSATLASPAAEADPRIVVPTVSARPPQKTEPQPERKAAEKKTPVGLFIAGAVVLLGLCALLIGGGLLLSGVLNPTSAPPTVAAVNPGDADTPAAPASDTPPPTETAAPEPTFTPTTPAAASVNLTGQWIGELVETTGDQRTFKAEGGFIQQTGASTFAGTVNIFFGGDTPFEIYTISDGTIDGLKVQFSEPGGRFFSGSIVGDTLVMSASFDCFDCNPWGRLTLIRAGAAPAQNAFTKSPPSIDGVASAGEWDPAVLGAETKNARIFYLNDGGTLYLLLDVIEDTDARGDFFALAFDVNENAQIDADTDVAYGVGASGLGLQRFLGPGTFTSLLSTESKMEYGFGATPASDVPHRFYEFALSFNELQTAPGERVRLGISIFSEVPAINEETPAGYMFAFDNLLEFTLGQ